MKKEKTKSQIEEAIKKFLEQNKQTNLESPDAQKTLAEWIHSYGGEQNES